jgi:hypothetical protein
LDLQPNRPEYQGLQSVKGRIKNPYTPFGRIANPAERRVFFQIRENSCNSWIKKHADKKQPRRPERKKSFESKEEMYYLCRSVIY